jgi:hypothetical protein
MYVNAVALMFASGKSQLKKEKKISFRFEISSRIIDLILVVMATTFLGACKKSTSDQQKPDGASPQLLCFTCGAGSVGGSIDPTVRTEWDVHNAKKTYYYSVIDISGNTTTVHSYQGYTGQHTIFETFTITK